MSKSATGEGRRADWSLRPRGPWSAAALSGLGLAVAAGIGHETGVDPLWAAAAGTVATVGTLAVHRDAGAGPLWYRLSCCIGGGGWLTWGLAHGIWSEWTAGSLGLGLLAAAILSPIARRPPLPRPAAPGDGGRRAVGSAVVLRRHVRQAQEWAARIHRVARIRVVVDEVRDWGNGYGFSMLLQQPAGPSTTRRLVQAAEGLAEDAGLEHGCGVEFKPGPRRGTLWMLVSTVNGLAEVIPFPGIRLGGSITDPDAIRLGQHRDGSVATVALRESSMIAAGQKRSGKTGLLHDITADAGALDDTVVWHMDLNGGGISRAWLRSWLQGRTARPAIDWAASCPEEALLMAHALIAIAKDRKATTADLKAEHNVQLLPVSRELPAILLILDEGKEVLGTKITDAVIREIRRRLEQLVDIGGNEAVNAVLSVLRSVSTALSTDILKQCSTRATMRVSDQSELDYLFGYRRGITPQDAPEQGSGFLAVAGSGPRPFKAFFMRPSDIDAAAVAIAEHRPDLDAAAAAAAGEAYATRLERMRYLFATPAEQQAMTAPAPIALPTGELWHPGGADEGQGDVDAGERLPTRRPPGTVERRSHLRLLSPGGVTAHWGDLDRRRPRRPAATHPRPAEQPLRAEHVREVDDGRPIPELLERALQLPWTGTPPRLHSERLAAQLGLSEHELAQLLAPLGVHPLPNAFERGGVRRRGYARADVEAAAAAIRRGDLDVPEEVASWTAA
ncbi:hypothetical protein [Nonomuraea aridisoli]|uniref:FtsK domain-containing protein n=1 Tax=Nonomuraea aridisoli TaxID=2070368 RepID=A0A2W2E8H6_9ACTN|nr:hypothetical protein [Nonomuraea aridisoli]PZG20586.1 hypothetical protein C1J01_08770 [Nonomuraea aridisoli]